MWKRNLLPAAEAYAMRRGLELTGSLGDGLDGSIWKVRGKKKRISWALKMHADGNRYVRERGCYERLAVHGVSEIEGFHVPVLIRCDDKSRAIEMSIVARPFMVDYAQAFLDSMPDFPEEVWQERLETWREDYGEDWPRVQRALAGLEELGIYYLDVHRGNISLP